MKIFTMVFAAIVVSGSAAYAAGPSAQDKTFVDTVGPGGMYEVMLGKLAETKGSTQDIKDQGNTEAHDHALVGDKLAAAAKDAGIPVPDKLTPEFQAQYDKIGTLSGAAFDAKYLSDMKKVHAGDGAAFLKEAKEGSNPMLKSFAADTFKIVQRHIGELDAKTSLK